MIPGRAISISLSVICLAGAILMAEGAPRSPQELARHAREAARNVAEARTNIEGAARDTEALARVVENIAVQVETSRRLLRTQLSIEDGSRDTAADGRRLAVRTDELASELETISVRLGRLSRLARGGVESSEDAAGRAARLEDAIGSLDRSFRRLIRQSRELNRKARGYRRLREGPR